MPTIVYRDGGLDPALLWNPFSMFDQLERGVLGVSRYDWPTFDVDDGEDATLLTADLPGMRDEDIDVSVSGSVLTVRGERKPTGSARRRPYGTFERQFRLADGYDLDAISAHLADGVLTIHLPKSEQAKPRRIKVSASRRMVDKVKGLLGGRSEGTAPGQ